MFIFFLTVSGGFLAGDDKAYRPYPSCAYAGAGHVVPLYPADSCRHADELGKGMWWDFVPCGLSETTILYKNVLKKYYGNGDYAHRYFPRLSSGRNGHRGNRFHLARSRQSYYGRDQPRDYPVVQAVIVWMASAFMVVNLLTDISYTAF